MLVDDSSATSTVRYFYIEINRFEEAGDRFVIRYRVEGVLYDMESPPRHLAEPVLARLRHLTGLTALCRERLVTARLGESVVLEFSPLLR